MNSVDFMVARIHVALLLEQLQRGPRFTRLPPANYWHNHPNEKKRTLRVGTHIRDGQGGNPALNSSRRKWMRDLTIAEPLGGGMPVPLRMPTKQYVYRSFTNNAARKERVVEILRAVHQEGEVCGTQQVLPYLTSECSSDCRCIVPVKRDNADHIIKHAGPHACMHTTWRYQ